MQAVKPVGRVGPAYNPLHVYDRKEYVSFTATKVTQECQEP